MPGVTNIKAMRAQAQHPCEAVPDNAYTQFLSGMRRAHSKRGNGLTSEIDNAPSALCDLPAYFSTLAVGKLASCWVACLTDAVNPEEAGNMARALIVVAHRLHNVTFATPDVPCPRQALDGEHPMPFALQTTTPPPDLKTARKTPPHISDAAETIRTAPMHWRWFHWESCPDKGWGRAAKRLTEMTNDPDGTPTVRVYRDGENKTVVENTKGQPQIGPAPAPAAKANSYDAKPSNEVGRRAESPARRVLKALEESGEPMTMAQLREAMNLAQSPAAAVALLLDQGKVTTTDGPEGTIIVELAGDPIES